MKISCLPVSLFDEINAGVISLEQWFAAQDRLGLDGVDLSISFIRARSYTYLHGLRRQLDETGANPVMVTTYPDFTHPDPVQREREASYLSADISVCAQLGVPYLRVLAGQAHPGVEREAGMHWAVEWLCRADEEARRKGVCLLFENHSKPGAWAYWDFSYPTDIFLELMHRLRGTGIRLNFDTGNTFAYGDDPLPVLEQVVDRLETLHISDMRRRGELSPVLVGTGAAPIGEIFRFVRQRGFDGWLCIEEASFGGMEGIRQAVENTRALWKAAE